MVPPDPLEDIQKELKLLKAEGESFFRAAKETVRELVSSDTPEGDWYWTNLPEELQANALKLRERVTRVLGLIAFEAKNAALATEADQQDIKRAVKVLRAALLFRNHEYWPGNIEHDEGTFIAYSPPGQSEDRARSPEQAERLFNEWMSKLDSIVELVLASINLPGARESSGAGFARSRFLQDTAFIIMSMDPELNDAMDAVKETFSNFRITASRADDIEHADKITDRIIQAIKTSEFLFADLTLERPNVYYEVGYAHALGKRVWLYRKKGTGLHFDLAGYNCPEYENLRDLKLKLTRRIESAMNQSPKEGVLADGGKLS